METLLLAFIDWLKQLSYAGVLLALCFEFVPAELVLPIAGSWVADGELRFFWTVVAGTIGGTIGPLTLYYLGRFGGRPAVLRYGKYFLIKENHINKADLFFEKYGAMVAFTARFLPVVRTVISVPCGIAKMHIGLFTLYTFLATIPLTAFYVYLGMTFRQNWDLISAYSTQYLVPFSIVMFLLLVTYIAIKRTKIAR